MSRIVMYFTEFNRRARGLIDQVFERIPRPEQSLSDPDHCSECREHARTLEANTLESLSYNDVGSPGWNPTCYMSDEGFRYWFPALTRIASELPHEGYWRELFGFHLRPDLNRQHAFTAQEQAAILQVFQWMLELQESEPDLFGLEAEELSANASAWRAQLRAL